MKKLIFTVLCLAASYTSAKPLVTQSDIVGVTVFKQGALVERRARVKLAAGVNEVKIPFISPELDQRSLQVGVSNLDVTLGSVKVDFELPRRLELAAVSDSLTKRMSLLNDTLSMLAELSSVFERERMVLLRNYNIGGDKGFDAARLQGVAEYLRKDLDEVGDNQYSINKTATNYNHELKQLEQEVLLLDEQLYKQCGVVNMVLVAPAASETEINIKYFVKDAKWNPSYEIRINGNQPSTLQLTSKAQVSQLSKEDWMNVPLTVSLNNPNEASALPKLERYTLPYARNGYSAAKPKANDMVKVMGVVRDGKRPLMGTLVSCYKNSLSVLTDSTGFYELLVPKGATLKFDYSSYTKYRDVRGDNVMVCNVVFDETNNQKARYAKITGSARYISGRVLNSEGGIAKTKVSIKGTDQQVETDDNGFFRIEARTGQTLLVEHPDYKPLEEVVVGGRNRYDLLPEKHGTLVGSSACLSAEKLQGRVAGVQAITTSGQSGAPAKITIRGTSTLRGSAEPLYVVDGMPLGGGREGSANSNPLASINPADIESMEVLKDASATSIYGARASNGVVIITTKKNGSASFQNELEVKLQDYTAQTNDKVSVPADGVEREAELNIKQVPVTFSYYAAPKVSPAVYLLASVPNWKNYDLQDGRVKVFKDNAFVGNTYITRNFFSDTLTFSVSRADDVLVERRLVTQNHKEGLLKQADKVTRKWLITLKNNKREPVKIIVNDRIPVSERKGVKVELLNAAGAKVDEYYGLLSWNLNLAPGEKRELYYTYTVSVKNTNDYDIEDFFEDEEEYENTK
ncbi:MAG: mucoidy inhibitor MuiA family protein [Paludibacteraceae bacterium]|nr:mucoidy inhibitor MuiA family protein [Paludibacteraceae bacterium]